MEAKFLQQEITLGWIKMEAKVLNQNQKFGFRWKQFELDGVKGLAWLNNANLKVLR
jgi:hypothetical protein